MRWWDPDIRCCEVQYQEVPIDTTVTAGRGEFVSQNYPENYPENYDEVNIIVNSLSKL